jgi:hypothetical protein
MISLSTHVDTDFNITRMKLQSTSSNPNTDVVFMLPWLMFTLKTIFQNSVTNHRSGISDNKSKRKNVIHFYVASRWTAAQYEDYISYDRKIFSQKSVLASYMLQTVQKKTRGASTLNMLSFCRDSFQLQKVCWLDRVLCVGINTSEEPAVSFFRVD